MLRALLSGNTELFEEALVELSGMSRNRVSGLLHDRGGVSLNALLSKAGMPESTYPAFRAALDASHEIGFVGTVEGATRLRRRMVERVLTQCESLPQGAAESLLILLRRFATESAREEARLFCDELVAADQALAESYLQGAFDNGAFETGAYEPYDLDAAEYAEFDAEADAGAGDIASFLASFHSDDDNSDDYAAEPVFDETDELVARTAEIFSSYAPRVNQDYDIFTERPEPVDRLDRVERSIAFAA